MLSCRVLGHRYRFTAEGPVMTWRCERGCGEERSKTYATPDEAARYARAFDKEDRKDLGRRTPIGLIPLAIVRAFRRRGR